MVSKTKLYSKLDNLEAELVERLIPHLEQAAAGNNEHIFCVEGYHSLPKLKKHSDPVMTELTDLGAEILSLKRKLGEPSEGSVAERICWYCREWGNTNHHRASGKKLAQQFLAELKAHH